MRSDAFFVVPLIFLLTVVSCLYYTGYLLIVFIHRPYLQRLNKGSRGFLAAGQWSLDYTWQHTWR